MYICETKSDSYENGDSETLSLHCVLAYISPNLPFVHISQEYSISPVSV